ncbi:hypothetical protein PInf_015897 [Phytophthora infestans]|nr:hypothetical protein PInf_015897 [Phytophthora infestans]
MSRHIDKSNTPSSPEPRTPPRAADPLIEDIEDGQVDQDDPMDTDIRAIALSPLISTRGSTTHESARRDYDFETRDPVETACRATQQIVDTYVCDPVASAADEGVRRQRIRERFLTPQVITL